MKTAYLREEAFQITKLAEYQEIRELGLWRFFSQIDENLFENLKKDFKYIYINKFETDLVWRIQLISIKGSKFQTQTTQILTFNNH